MNHAIFIFIFFNTVLDIFFNINVLSISSIGGKQLLISSILIKWEIFEILGKTENLIKLGYQMKFRTIFCNTHSWQDIKDETKNLFHLLLLQIIIFIGLTLGWLHLDSIYPTTRLIVVCENLMQDVIATIGENVDNGEYITTLILPEKSSTRCEHSEFSIHISHYIVLHAFFLVVFVTQYSSFRSPPRSHMDQL